MGSRSVSIQYELTYPALLTRQYWSCFKLFIHEKGIEHWPSRSALSSVLYGAKNLPVCQVDEAEEEEEEEEESSERDRPEKWQCKKAC